MLPQSTGPERVRIGEAGDILGLPTSTVLKLAQTGRIPGAAQIGRRWTFNVEKLRTFVRRKEQQAWQGRRHPQAVIGDQMFSGVRFKSKAGKYSGPWEQMIQELPDSDGRPARRKRSPSSTETRRT